MDVVYLYLTKLITIHYGKFCKENVEKKPKSGKMRFCEARDRVIYVYPAVSRLSDKSHFATSPADLVSGPVLACGCDSEATTTRLKIPDTPTGTKRLRDA